MANKYASGLTAGQYLGLLKADFSDIEKLDEICNKVLYRMMMRDYNTSQAKKFGVSFSDYKHAALQEKGGFAGMVRNEVGRTLAIVAAKQRDKIPDTKGGLKKAIGYGIWKKSPGGSVGFHSTGKKKLESVSRAYVNRRPASDRTISINRYYGRDRAWILRILNSGTVNGDRTSTTMNAHGIQAEAHYQPIGKQKNRNYKPLRTYRGGIGNRGTIEARNYFSSANSDMQRAADELAVRMENISAEILETAFTEGLKD